MKTNRSFGCASPYIISDFPEKIHRFCTFCSARTFLCRIDCWECAPRLSQSQQSVLSFRMNLRGSPDQVQTRSEFQARNESLTSSPQSKSGPKPQKVRTSRKDRAFRAVQGKWYLSQSLRSFAPCKRSKPFCFSSRCALFVSDWWLGDAPRDSARISSES